MADQELKDRIVNLVTVVAGREPEVFSEGFVMGSTLAAENPDMDQLAILDQLPPGWVEAEDVTTAEWRQRDRTFLLGLTLGLLTVREGLVETQQGAQNV